MKKHPHTFKVGEIVRAMAPLWRVDRASQLAAGDLAKVITASTPTKSKIQLITITPLDEQKNGHMALCDLVCSDLLPLEYERPA